MSLAGLQPVVAASAGAGGDDGRALAALRATGRRLEANDPKLAEQAAAQVVSQLFFAPLLAEMRKLPFGREFAIGGRTEEIFGEQLDLRIADSVAANCGGLTRQLTERLQGNDGGQGAPQGGSVEAGSSQADSRPATGHTAGDTTMVHT
jgi:hypothetical protein